MQLSVIIPVYNSEKFIESALKSALRQNISDYEIVAVDDGSTDRSGEILDSYAALHPEIHVIHQGNQGVSGARNTGIDAASGKYLMFMDADDEYVENSLGWMLRTAEKRGADLVIGEAHRIETFSERALNQSVVLSQKKTIRKDDPDILYNITIWNKLYRRSIVDKYHLRFPKLKHVEDGVFYLTYVSKCEKIVGCPKFIYKYYVRSSLVGINALKSLNRQTFDDAMSAVREIEQLFADYPEEFRKEWLMHTLRITIISEYYRRFWLMDESMERAVLERSEEYHRRVGEEGWKRIQKIYSGLSIGDHLLRREELLQNPAVSILIPAGLSPEKLNASLDTLYYQMFPEFEVVLDSSYGTDLAGQYRWMDNLHLCRCGERGWGDLLSASKGQYIQILGDAMVYDEKSLVVMVKSLGKSLRDFVSMKPVHFQNGEASDNSFINEIFTKIKIPSDSFRKVSIQADHLIGNKLFRRPAAERLARTGITDYTELTAYAFRNMLYERTEQCAIGTFEDLPMSAQGGM